MSKLINRSNKSKQEATENTSEIFTAAVLQWGQENGRKHLPWQQQISPYRVWISEIMLQQTQVETVIPYFHKFMHSFPDLQTLAEAEIDDVLHHWSGLGYYARARNLYKTAVILVKRYAGDFPQDLEKIQALPGIGRSTAGAIMSLSMGKPVSILDGNVKRVLARCFAVNGWPGQSSVLQQLWQLADEMTPEHDTALYNQTMMDLGATVCKRSSPICDDCPLKTICRAKLTESQSHYPGKKPKKAIPTKITAMVLLLNDKRQVLLEQRPPAGIWGGLWSFPEVAGDTAMDMSEQVLADSLGMAVEILEQLPCRRHTFSHFHLEIYPLLCRHLSTLEVKDRPQDWFDLQEENFQVGLAAPVSELLQEIKLNGVCQ